MCWIGWVTRSILRSETPDSASIWASLPPIRSTGTCSASSVTVRRITATARRLRDVWRENILRQRGWRLHRIWSTRWWYYRGEEIEKLKAALEDAGAALELQLERRPEAAPTAIEERESWQMPLAQWKKLREELQARGDTEGLRRIGGLGTAIAHRAKVEQAVRQGKAVPDDVLADYPDLRQSAPNND